MVLLRCVFFHVFIGKRNFILVNSIGKKKVINIKFIHFVAFSEYMNFKSENIFGFKLYWTDCPLLHGNKKKELIYFDFRRFRD